MVLERIVARKREEVRARMAALRVGDPLDKSTDIGAVHHIAFSVSRVTLRHSKLLPL